ncbi:MAG: hypothetical protein KJ069_22010 [Anaerolineae bacterium]|nr:hypothetical protein [Anaerolineae bacterium]
MMALGWGTAVPAATHIGTVGVGSGVWVGVAGTAVCVGTAVPVGVSVGLFAVVGTGGIVRVGGTAVTFRAATAVRVGVGSTLVQAAAAGTKKAWRKTVGDSWRNCTAIPAPDHAPTLRLPGCMQMKERWFRKILCGPSRYMRHEASLVTHHLSRITHPSSVLKEPEKLAAERGIAPDNGGRSSGNWRIAGRGWSPR